jgi:hypothetical protein
MTSRGYHRFVYNFCWVAVRNFYFCFCAAHLGVPCWLVSCPHGKNLGVVVSDGRIVVDTVITVSRLEMFGRTVGRAVSAFSRAVSRAVSALA